MADDDLEAQVGTKRLSAHGPLALAVVIVLITGALAVYGTKRVVDVIVWQYEQSHTDHEVAMQKTIEAVVAAQKAILDALDEADRRQSAAHAAIINAERLQACLMSYDFEARKRLRARAEAGQLNLGAWCSWLNGVTGAIPPGPTPD